MNFKKKALNKAIANVLVGTALLSAAQTTPVFAANHPNSNVSAKQTDGTQVLDLTLNTDWDYDTEVMQKGTSSNPRYLSRTYVTDLINQTARTLFVMTNGKHRIGKVYVFKNGKFGNNVDIRVLNTTGRANADISGWRNDGGLTTNNYITNCASSSCDANTADSGLIPEGPVETGEVIAHELGHYVYGLFDEYVEAGKACGTAPAEQSSPCGTDVERPTAMNNQAFEYRISTPEDYPSKDYNKTAQGRAYGVSAWETLSSDPANDIEVAQASHNGRRTQFDAFKGLSTPALASLRKFTSDKNTSTPDERLARQTGSEASTFTGYNTDLKIIFEDSSTQPKTAQPEQPRNVIVIDRTLPQATFAEAIKAAEGLVDRAAANMRFALVTYPTNASQGYQLMDTTNKQALKTALAALTTQTGTADLQQAYTNAKALVTAARPTDPTQENAGNTDTVTLYTLNTTSVPATLGQTARNDKIAFNVIGFKAPAAASTTTSAATPPTTPPASANSLEKLAKDSGGANNTATTAKEAIKEASKGLQSAMGETEALIAADVSDDTLKAGSNFDTQFVLGDAKVEGPVEVRWFLNTADKGKLTFSCIAPGGTITTATVAAISDEESQATCTLTAAPGTWTARATAGTQDATAVEVEVVSKLAGSPVEATATIEGGTKTDNRAPKLLVKLNGTFPIINAQIKVEVFDATSTSGTPLKTFTLNSDNDSGKNGDGRANDGIYTLNLANLFGAGSYAVVVTAKTDTNSKFNPVQMFVSAATPAPGASPVGSPIERLAETEFNLESGATGVLASVGRGGGGCTVSSESRDASLVMMLAAAALAFVRRRRRVAAQ